MISCHYSGRTTENWWWKSLQKMDSVCFQLDWWIFFDRAWNNYITHSIMGFHFLSPKILTPVWFVQPSLRWRLNEHDGVSNHQPHDFLLNRLFRHRSRKTLKLCVTVLCAGNSPVTGEFPAQMASIAENVSIWWRHHDNTHMRRGEHNGWYIHLNDKLVIYTSVSNYEMFHFPTGGTLDNKSARICRDDLRRTGDQP